ncbi:hypothetical protein LINPERPRIM_LOCUS22972 [Linum perenne]
MNLLEEGTTSVNSNKSRPEELIQMLEDFGYSYPAFAERCDQLILASSHESSSMCTPPPYLNGRNDQSSKGRDDTIMDDEVIMNLIGQPMLSQGVQDKETNWSELKFQASKLMEENLWYQAEMARRNVEKKVTIDRLQLQVEHLKRQNTALLDCVSFFKMGKKPRRSSTSKLHQLWDKLFRKDQ